MKDIIFWDYLIYNILLAYDIVVYNHRLFVLIPV